MATQFLRPWDDGFSRARRRVVASVCAASGILSCSAAFILSRTAFFDAGIDAVAVALSVVSAVAILLPRLVGFPLMVASGSAIILFSWSFLVYPAAVDGVSIGRLRVSSNAVARVRFGASSEDAQAEISGDPSGLSVLLVEFDRRYPVVGATSRVSLDKLLLGDKTVSRPVRRSLLEIVGGAAGPTALTLPGVTSSVVVYPVAGDLSASGARLNLVWSAGTIECRPE